MKNQNCKDKKGRIGKEYDANIVNLRFFCKKSKIFLKKPLKTRVKPKRFCQKNIQYTLGKEFQPTVTIVFFELLK
ncbi:MAG: hypothetical protein II561_12180 [Thermoguttaceae bacterium]|nr:hypothetical protein [Thermoguttaceae bacterium]MBQ2557296.1 hypothetical protein [Thermoguttaceae bacterium]MBQ3821827.1 hypothetical protein [Thermoguttaceae bacterium]MBQ4202914.1 hypothetical protein [Thermoguttaceae bacterium]MBQ5368351.1 hypothetical protein [Thermoguttaceae bacterium]